MAAVCLKVFYCKPHILILLSATTHMAVKMSLISNYRCVSVCVRHVDEAVESLH